MSSLAITTEFMPCRRLHGWVLSCWGAKYDNALIRERLVCCLGSLNMCDVEYWIDDSITDNFCELADAMVLVTVQTMNESEIA